MKKLILFIFCTYSCSILSAKTPDYYRCVARVGGEWNYGRAPQACDASSFGDDRVLLQDYSELLFADAEQREVERARYMQDLHSVIRDASIYYLKKRKAEVSSDELNWFVLGIMTTAAQESYWSQYRVTNDNKLKMMRGDFGHGHGMMQVDDRAHFPAIERGVGWNLSLQLAYAMDIFYSGWQKSLTSTCVTSATDYTSRIRAAWAAYNGGPSKLCRWKNPNDPWAKNDKNFYNQLSNRSWTKFVGDQNKISPINIACLMEKGTSCAKPMDPVENPEPEVPKSQQLYTTNEGQACLFVNQSFQCVQMEKDRLCLLSLDQFSTEKFVSLSAELAAQFPKQILDRHSLCKQYSPNLIPVGQSVQTLKNINLRTSVGGGIVAVVPANSVLAVLDFEIRNASLNEYYYKVQFKQSTGFLYAGDAKSTNTWVKFVSDAPVPVSSVAAINQNIRVIKEGGINLRGTPGGSILTVVNKNAVVQVENVVIQSSDNEVYYLVSYNGKRGYIYSGKLLPKDTVKTWTNKIN